MAPVCPLEPKRKRANVWKVAITRRMLQSCNETVAERASCHRSEIPLKDQQIGPGSHLKRQKTIAFYGSFIPGSMLARKRRPSLQHLWQSSARPICLHIISS